MGSSYGSARATWIAYYVQHNVEEPRRCPLGNVTCSVINDVCSCAFDYPVRERVCCSLGTAAEFWYVCAMPRTGGAKEIVVRRCVDTPDNLLLAFLLMRVWLEERLNEHTNRRRDQYRCLLSVVSDCVCSACGDSRHKVQGARNKYKAAKYWVQRKDDTPHTDTGHVITRSPDTLARVYRGLTATSLLAGTLINDVMMPWHDSFQDVPGQESLFNDVDGACGLEALAGRFDWALWLRSWFGHISHACLAIRVLRCMCQRRR